MKVLHVLARFSFSLHCRRNHLWKRLSTKPNSCLSSCQTGASNSWLVNANYSFIHDLHIRAFSLLSNCCSHIPDISGHGLSDSVSLEARITNNIGLIGTIGRERAELHLRDLVGFGFDHGTIEELITNNPSSFQSGHLLDLSKNFHAFGFSLIQISSILKLCPEILDADIDFINDSLDILRQLGLDGSSIVTVVSMCPHVILKSKKATNTQYNLLKDLLSRKDLMRLVKSSPSVLLDDIDDISSKYNYVTMEMAISRNQVAQSNLFAHSIFHIKCRHKFLERAGLFKKVVKEKKGLEKANPHLRDIVDVSDEDFAKKHGNMTEGDYKTFVKMYMEEISVTESDDEV